MVHPPLKIDCYLMGCYFQWHHSYHCICGSWTSCTVVPDHNKL